LSKDDLRRTIASHVTDQLKARLLEATLATIDEVNEYLPDDRRLVRSPSTKLFGEQGALDSLGLVNFLLALEGRIADDFGQPVTLVSERALSQRSSPFATVASLAEYAAEVVDQSRRDG
jgi:hypothetical protein